MSRWMPHPPLGRQVKSPLKQLLQPKHATEIRGGEDNIGIFLHHLPKRTNNEKERLILEKQTAYRREYCLSKQLLTQQSKIKGSPLLSTFPRIFGVDISLKQCRPRYHLYMEFLPNSLCSQPVSLSMLEELARCSLRLHAILPELSKGFQLPPRRNILTPRNYSRLHQIFPSGSSSIAAKIIQLDSFLSGLPLMFAHTDLNWNNVRVSITRSGQQFKIIDFAWARQLPVGVEWHHFAAAARNSEENAQHFHFITNYYCSLLGLNPKLARASATLFALHVSLICRLGPKGKGPITLEQADAARSDAHILYKQAIAVLG